jgi:uncharacterized damage-inducible protein DinB
MGLVAHFRTMAEYNRWMNEKLYAICADIPDAERREDRGAFFRSIHGTLNHLLLGDKAWMARFESVPFSLSSMDAELHADFNELTRDRRETDERILVWTAGLSETWLEAPYEFKSKIDGKVRVRPTWLLVNHMFNHQTHHRGQLTTLLTQLGRDPGVTDLPWMPSLDQ